MNYQDWLFIEEEVGKSRDYDEFKESLGFLGKIWIKFAEDPDLNVIRKIEGR